jgi:hypothetical protein
VVGARGIGCGPKRDCGLLSKPITAVIMELGMGPSPRRKLTPTSLITGPSELPRIADLLPRAKGRAASDLGYRPAMACANRPVLPFAWTG